MTVTADYFVDSNATYAANHANNGTASGTPWGGAGGIQRALGVATAGQIIAVAGGATIDLRTLVKVVCTGTLVGTLAVDDFVYCFEFLAGVPTVAEAGAGQGYIVYITGKTYYIAVTSGTWTTGAAHCITKENAAVFSNYIEAITASTPGIRPITPGTATSRCRLIGVNSSWVVDGTRVKLDALGVAINCILMDGAADFFSIVNFELDQATAAGINFSTAASTCCYLENLWAHDCAGDGFTLTYFLYGLARRCRASANALNGFTLSNMCTLDACEAIGNTRYGLYAEYGPHVATNCTFHGSGTGYDGVTLLSEYMMVLLNCVVDGNVGDGLHVFGNANATLLGCRVTNNPTPAGASIYGLNIISGATVFLGHCLFTGNLQGGAADGDIGGTGAAGVVNLDIGASVTPSTNILDGTTAGGDGYTDDANHDFNLATDARLRSVADLLPDS